MRKTSLFPVVVGLLLLEILMPPLPAQAELFSFVTQQGVAGSLVARNFSTPTRITMHDVSTPPGFPYWTLDSNAGGFSIDTTPVQISSAGVLSGPNVSGMVSVSQTGGMSITADGDTFGMAPNAPASDVWTAAYVSNSGTEYQTNSWLTVVRPPAALATGELAGTWFLKVLRTPNYVSMRNISTGTNAPYFVMDSNASNFGADTDTVTLLADGSFTTAGGAYGTATAGAAGDITIALNTGGPVQTFHLQVNASKDVMVGVRQETDSGNGDVNNQYLLFVKAPDSVSGSDLADRWNLRSISIPNAITIINTNQGEPNTSPAFILGPGAGGFSADTGSIQIRADGTFTGPDSGTGTYVCGSQGAVTIYYGSQTMSFNLNAGKNLMTDVHTESSGNGTCYVMDILSRAPRVYTKPVLNVQTSGTTSHLNWLDVPGVACQPQVSSDLLSWNPVPGSVQVSGSLRSLDYSAPQPAPRQYFRLGLSEQPVP
jgi:hypothetical protein